jgi:hypothetical protein
MLHLKKALAAGAATLLLGLGVAACGATDDATSTSVSTQAPAASASADVPTDGGTITEAQADAYREQLVDAYTFRITWDGQAATPTAEAV